MALYLINAADRHDLSFCRVNVSKHKHFCSILGQFFRLSKTPTFWMYLFQPKGCCCFIQLSQAQLQFSEML